MPKVITKSTKLAPKVQTGTAGRKQGAMAILAAEQFALGMAEGTAQLGVTFELSELAPLLSAKRSAKVTSPEGTPEHRAEQAKQVKESLTSIVAKWDGKDSRPVPALVAHRAGDDFSIQPKSAVEAAE